MSKVDQITETLVRRILRAEIAPGDRLPPFRTIAEEFGTTLPTAQRVVGKIEELGLVEVVQGRGATVLDPRIAAGPDVLAYWVDALEDRPREAIAIITDFLALRRTLATEAIAGLAAAPTDAHARVAAAVDALAEAADGPIAGIVEADLAVVRAILAARPNIALATVFNSFAKLLRRHEPLKRAMYAAPRDNVDGYRALLGLIAEEPEAAAAVAADVLKMIDNETLSRLQRETP